MEAAVLMVDGNDPYELSRFVQAQAESYDIFGSPDDMKLRSCATLFAQILDPGSVFERLLSEYFESLPDQRTLDLIGSPPAIG
ncbi:MAG: DUF1810 family protein [Nodosilinea sp.]